MRFYKHSHAFYCGVDLHARSMFTHILDNDGKTACERWSRIGRGLDSLANAPIDRAFLFGDRARRFAWPVRGTERFLGR